ncbi:hypothetical protein [Phascolarctobacterium sp.]|uniref:hypothetical protein n=1 Tax=Phascolarctobacterium sp. TaxID=2049039 RepID=UPI00307745F3
MDTLTFNGTTYTGTYVAGNNGSDGTFTVTAGTTVNTTVSNLTMARLNNQNVYIQSGDNNGQFFVMPA